MKKKQELEERAAYVRNGGDLKRFKANEVIALQDYALGTKDLDLWDTLEGYWTLWERV